MTPFDRQAVLAWRVFFALMACFYIVLGALVWEWLK